MGRDADKSTMGIDAGEDPRVLGIVEALRRIPDFPQPGDAVSLPPTRISAASHAYSPALHILAHVRVRTGILARPGSAHLLERNLTGSLRAKLTPRRDTRATREPFCTRLADRLSLPPSCSTLFFSRRHPLLRHHDLDGGCEGVQGLHRFDGGEIRGAIDRIRGM